MKNAKLSDVQIRLLIGIVAARRSYVRMSASPNPSYVETLQIIEDELFRTLRGKESVEETPKVSPKKRGRPKKA